MPHGTPDWGLVGPKSTVYGLDDLGEHAARLGAIPVWDRRGDQVWATDFRNGLGDAETNLAGLGAAAALHTGAARQGAYCLKLTAGRDGFQYAEFRKRLPYLVMGKAGVEASFSYEADTAHVQLEGYIRNGTGRWYPTLRLDPNTGLLEVRTAPLGAFVQVSATAFAYQTAQCCNTIKMVYDPTRVFGVYTGYYVRAIVNEMQYDLTAHPIYYMGGVFTPISFFSYWQYADGGKNPVSYMDCFVVTQNEP